VYLAVAVYNYFSYVVPDYMTLMSLCAIQNLTVFQKTLQIGTNPPLLNEVNVRTRISTGQGGINLMIAHYVNMEIALKGPGWGGGVVP